MFCRQHQHVPKVATTIDAIRFHIPFETCLVTSQKRLTLFRNHGLGKNARDADAQSIHHTPHKSTLVLVAFSIKLFACTITTTMKGPLDILILTVTLFELTSSFSTQSSSPSRTVRMQLGLTSEEILAKARQAAGLPAEEADNEYPKVFEDSLLSDMQSALIKLERRVQQGPGALSVLEVEEFDAELQRVLEEMRVNGDVRPTKNNGVASPSTVTVDTQAEAVAVSPSVQNTAPAPEIVPTEALQGVNSPATQSMSTPVIDTSNDEGPAYDGKSGMGQPRGTVNTYIIEGMEEMTSDEYRTALERSLIDRQQARRKMGIVGNKSSWDYLNSISPGDTGPLRKDIYGESEAEEPAQKSFKPYGQQ